MPIISHYFTITDTAQQHSPPAQTPPNFRSTVHSARLSAVVDHVARQDLGLGAENQPVRLTGWRPAATASSATPSEDGQAYSHADFVEQYGGTDEWDDAEPVMTKEDASDSSVWKTFDESLL